MSRSTRTTARRRPPRAVLAATLAVALLGGVAATGAPPAGALPPPGATSAHGSSRAAAATGPSFTTAPSATFTEAAAATATIAVQDTARAGFTWTGALPNGVSLVNTRDGSTAQLVGTPLVGTAGTYPLTVTAVDSAGHTATQAFTLTVQALPAGTPVIDHVAPPSGPAGTAVDITGSFTAGSVTGVAFGSVPATSFSPQPDGSVLATAPAAAAGPADVTITVTNPAGGPPVTSPVTPTDRFTVQAPPQPPSPVQATPEGLGALATWVPAAPADGVTSYTVTAQVVPGYQSTSDPACNDPAPTPTPGGDSAAEVDGLCAGIPYDLSVSATNASGTSPAAAFAAPVIPLAAQPPSAPLITSTLARPGALLVTWAAPGHDGGSQVSSYQLTATPPSGAPVAVSVPAGATSSPITGLVDGTTYTVSLTATSAAGTSEPSTSSGTPSATHRPGAPAGFEVVPDGAGGLQVTWLPPADTGSAPLTRYTLTYQPTTLRAGAAAAPATTKTALHLPPTTTSYDLRGLVGTGYYTVAVSASSKLGAGPSQSTGKRPVTPDVVAAPGAIELTPATMAALISDDQGVLTWPSPPPAQLAGIQSGSVLDGAPSSAAPDGLLALVQSVAPAGPGGFVVYTTAATLSQAFSTFSYSLAGTPPGAAAAAPRARTAGISVVHRDGQDPSINVDVNCGGTGISICGPVAFTPTVSGGAGVVCNGFLCLSQFYAYADVAASISASENLKVGVSGSTTVPLLKLPLGAIPIFLGIVIIPEVDVNLAVSGNLSITTSASVNASGELDWNSGSGFTTSSSTASSASGGAIDNVSGSANVQLQIIPSLCVDGVGCGYLQLDGTLAATLSYPSPPPFLQICPGIDLKAGLKLNLIFWNPSADVTLASASFPCFTLGSSPVTLALSPGTGSCFGLPQGVDVQTFTATRSDGGTFLPVTWSILGGLSGDSIPPSGQLTLAPRSWLGDVFRVQAVDGTGLIGTALCSTGNTSWLAPPLTGIHLQPSGSGGGGLAGGTQRVTWQPPAQSGDQCPVVGYVVQQTGATGPLQYRTAVPTLTIPSDPEPGTGAYGLSVWAQRACDGSSQPGGATYIP